MQTDLQEEKFDRRLGLSESITHLLMGFLKRKGVFKTAVKATTGEDIEDAVDYTFDGVPAQWKLRIRAGNGDFPFVRYQPFWGIDSPETVVGRDYRGLIDGLSEHYYVAAVQKDGSMVISRASKERLQPYMDELEQSWSQRDRGRPQFRHQGVLTAAENKRLAAQNCDARGKGLCLLYTAHEESLCNWQVWWQKNASERFSKINLYLPNALREESWTVEAATFARMVATAEAFINKNS